MTDNVTELPLSEHLKPEQALAEAMKDASEYDKIMILAVRKDGTHISIHSHITQEQGLYIVEYEKTRIMIQCSFSHLLAETPLGDYVDG